MDTLPDGPLLSFDGGARTQGREVHLPPGSSPAVGAGIALWPRPAADGRRSCIMQVVAAIPRLANSMLGEGAGLGYALSAMLAAVTDHIDLTILGDNLPVIRVGAATGSLRTDGVWAEIEAPPHGGDLSPMEHPVDRCPSPVQ